MPSLVEIITVVLEKRFLKVVTLFLLFPNYLPFGKALHLNKLKSQNCISFTQGCFVKSLIEIGPVVLEKKMKMGKVYRQTEGWTDGQRDSLTTDDR